MGMVVGGGMENDRGRDFARVSGTVPPEGVMGKDDVSGFFS